MSSASKCVSRHGGVPRGVQANCATEGACNATRAAPPLHILPHARLIHQTPAWANQKARRGAAVLFGSTPKRPAPRHTKESTPCTASSASNSLYLGTAGPLAVRRRTVPLRKPAVPRAWCSRCTSSRTRGSYVPGPGKSGGMPHAGAERGARKRLPEQPKAPCRDVMRLETSVKSDVSASVSYAPGPGADCLTSLRRTCTCVDVKLAACARAVMRC